MSDKEKEERPSLLYRVGEDWPAGIVGFISMTSIIMMAVTTQR
jgi:hypothetical protein